MSTFPKTIDKGELAYEAISILKKNNITQLLDANNTKIPDKISNIFIKDDK